MASTARLSFFYRHHNAYRIQEMPNHNSSTWENESELIHFFVSRILDESKLIHSGVYVNLYVYPPWLSSLWTGTCFASIACGHPHAHFWGVPQTPALFLRDDSDADDANDAVLGISLYHIPDSASLASSEFYLFRSMRLFRRSTLETDCWCGGMSFWTGWSSKRSIKPKTRTRRLSGLMNSFLRTLVVVFVSRKETMHRERHI